jgi:hypothetical protein
MKLDENAKMFPQADHVLHGAVPRETWCAAALRRQPSLVRRFFGFQYYVA